VTVFDSRQLSLGTGFLVQTAAKAAAEGRSMDEILALLDEQISRTHVFAALDTLEYLRRSGRMSWAVAGLGSLLQVKPLLKMYDGDPTSERVRTTNGATERLIELLSELAPFERVALIHTHATDRAEALRERVLQLLPAGDIPSVDITPVIGAHIGPGAVGFACVRESAR
jgi:DegV family protein with EDD domain